MREEGGRDRDLLLLLLDRWETMVDFDDVERRRRRGGGNIRILMKEEGVMVSNEICFFVHVSMLCVGSSVLLCIVWCTSECYLRH